jgi:hypothetical protein
MLGENMKYLLIIAILLLQFRTVIAEDYFNNNRKVNLYKVGYFKDFQGKLIKFENLKINKTKQQNSNITEFRFHRLDEKVFTSKDLKEWLEVIDFTDINSSYGLNSYIRISPNPVIENLMIYSNEGEKFEIYSVYGIKVLEGITQIQIDVRTLNSGFYLLKIGTVITKFIKI